MTKLHSELEKLLATAVADRDEGTAISLLDAIHKHRINKICTEIYELKTMELVGRLSQAAQHPTNEERN